MYQGAFGLSVIVFVHNGACLSIITWMPVLYASTSSSTEPLMLFSLDDDAMSLVNSGTMIALYFLKVTSLRARSGYCILRLNCTAR